MSCFSHYLGLGKIKIISGPIAAARMGQGAEPCSHGIGWLRNFLGRALRLRQARGPSAAATCLTFKFHVILDPCTKLIGGGGVKKTFFRNLPKVELRHFLYCINSRLGKVKTISLPSAGQDRLGGPSTETRGLGTANT